MTALAPPTERTAAAPPPRVRAVALALLIPLGPLAVAALRTILPYDTGDSAATTLSKVAAHQDTVSATLWLGMVATFALVPGTLAIALPAARRLPGLGTFALVLPVAGFLGLTAITGGDQVTLSAARTGLDPAAAARLLDDLRNQPTVAASTLVFIAGHVIGVVLLGIALWRAEIIPGWAGLVLAVSQPLHLIFAVIVPVHLLDGAAWGLTTVGYAVAALSITRLPQRNSHVA